MFAMGTACKNAEIRREIETKEYLSSILRFDSETGCLFWIRGLNGSSHREKKAGTVVKKDKRTGYPEYVKVAIRGLDFKAHRIAWVLYHGSAPQAGKYIDHINGNPMDNRIGNLRLSCPAGNSRNSKTPKTNSSGYKGVVGVNGSPRFRAFICVNRKQIHLGMFDTKEAAYEAYKSAAIKHFGEFSCLDR